MNHLLVFFKKELRECHRTYKLFILVAAFFILGMMSPLTAKLAPELLPRLLPEGVSLELPQPSSLDSWAQFFKNIKQMGLVVVVLVFSGSLAGEISQGTLINLVTKGLSRQAVICAKYGAMLALWTVSIAAAFVVTWGYTIYLFPDDKSHNLFLAVFCLWLFGAFLLAQLLFSAALVSSSYGSLILTGGALVFLTILQIFPRLRPWNPLLLAAQNIELVANALEPQALGRAAGTAVFAACLLLTAAVALFRKRQL